MDDRDRALLAEIAERDRRSDAIVFQDGRDRHELLRIVREQDALLRERDTQAEDRADDAAATEATKGRWR